MHTSLINIQLIMTPMPFNNRNVFISPQNTTSHIEYDIVYYSSMTGVNSYSCLFGKVGQCCLRDLACCLGGMFESHCYWLVYVSLYIHYVSTFGGYKAMQERN